MYITHAETLTFFETVKFALTISRESTLGNINLTFRKKEPRHMKKLLSLLALFVNNGFVGKLNSFFKHFSFVTRLLKKIVNYKV